MAAVQVPFPGHKRQRLRSALSENPKSRTPFVWLEAGGNVEEELYNNVEIFLQSSISTFDSDLQRRPRVLEDSAGFIGDCLLPAPKARPIT